MFQWCYCSSKPFWGTVSVFHLEAWPPSKELHCTTFDGLFVCGLEIPQRNISVTVSFHLLSHRQSRNCRESCILDKQQTFENSPYEDQNISSTCTNLMEMMLQIMPSMGFAQTKQKKMHERTWARFLFCGQQCYCMSTRNKWKEAASWWGCSCWMIQDRSPWHQESLIHPGHPKHFLLINHPIPLDLHYVITAHDINLPHHLVPQWTCE